MYATEPMKHMGAEWFKVMSRQDDHIFTDATRPVAVIPCRSAQQARKLAAFWNLTEKERVERLADILQGHDAIGNPFNTQARAVLAAITGGRT